MKNRNFLVFLLVCGIFFCTYIAKADIKNNKLKTTTKPLEYIPPNIADFSKMSWSTAFTALHKKMALEFAYTKHLNINWDALYKKYYSLILKAEQNHDIASYYIAMREYITSLHENHTNIWVSTKTNVATTKLVGKLVNAQIGGSYGLILTKLDDGSFIASYIVKNGAADLAAIKVGATITLWNGKPIQQALADLPTTWIDEQSYSYTKPRYYCSESPGTSTGINYEKLRLLVRGAIGSKVTIAFKNQDETAAKSASLIAKDDQYQIFLATALNKDNNSGEGSNKIITSTLPPGFGYIKIIDMTTDKKDITKTKSYRAFKTAMKNFIQQKVPGVILDIRGNGGGNDELTAAMLGFFTDQKIYILNTVPYNKLIHDFDTTYGSLYVDPQKLQYHGPVVVLTDLATMCAAESLPLIMQKLPQAHILSFYPNTSGSYSMRNGPIKMPAGLRVEYAVRRIEDENGKIIIEADQYGNGGVKTDVKIPMTQETAVAIYTDKKDIALQFALKYLQSIKK